MEEKTGGRIGITETLVVSSVSGIIFSLFAGMPLIITGKSSLIPTQFGHFNLPWTGVALNFPAKKIGPSDWLRRLKNTSITSEISQFGCEDSLENTEKILKNILELVHFVEW